MISRKQTISGVINQVALYLSLAALALCLVLGFFVIEQSRQQQQTLFDAHVTQLAQTFAATGIISAADGQGASQLLNELAELNTYYELTDADGQVQLRLGDNRGELQASAGLEGSNWQLLGRRTLLPPLQRLRLELGVLAGAWLLFNLVLVSLARQVRQLFNEDFRQMAMAVDTERDESGSPLATNILLQDFYDLQQRLLELVREGRQAKAFIRDESTRDMLTSLANARRFADSQHKYYQMAGRQVKVQIVLMDIDQLEAVNKQHGREVGDQLIKGVSDILRAAIRHSDDCYYLGNGRFVVAMVGAEAEEVLKWHEFLTRRFEVLAQSLQKPGQQPVAVSVSASAARVSRVDESLSDTLRRGEEVLASVKQQSKGIIVIVRDPVAEFPNRQVNREDDTTQPSVAEQFNHPWQ